LKGCHSSCHLGVILVTALVNGAGGDEEEAGDQEGKVEEKKTELVTVGLETWLLTLQLSLECHWGGCSGYCCGWGNHELGMGRVGWMGRRRKWLQLGLEGCHLGVTPGTALVTVRCCATTSWGFSVQFYEAIKGRLDLTLGWLSPGMLGRCGTARCLQA